MPVPPIVEPSRLNTGLRNPACHRLCYKVGTTSLITRLQKLTKAKADMRRRPSARLLIIDPSGRVLLFRFVHRNGALAGQDYWATPGGGVKESETFEQAAIRELKEETCIQVNSVGRQIGKREFVLQLPSGEYVIADERYFLIETSDVKLSRAGWSSHEAEVMTNHKWWPPEELAQ